MTRPRTGKALSAAERMRRYRARRRAAGLRTTARWTPRVPVWSDHRVAEAKSLALHVIAARRIAANPRLSARARATELSEEGARLRQSSPLPTLLSEVERRRVHRAFRA